MHLLLLSVRTLFALGGAGIPSHPCNGNGRCSFWDMLGQGAASRPLLIVPSFQRANGAAVQKVTGFNVVQPSYGERVWATEMTLGDSDSFFFLLFFSQSTPSVKLEAPKLSCSALSCPSSTGFDRLAEYLKLKLIITSIFHFNKKRKYKRRRKSRVFCTELGDWRRWAGISLSAWKHSPWYREYSVQTKILRLGHPYRSSIRWLIIPYLAPPAP